MEATCLSQAPSRQAAKWQQARLIQFNDSSYDEENFLWLCPYQQNRLGTTFFIN